MSRDIPGLVQTSLNLGILAAEADRLTATFCVRSSVGSQKELLHRRLPCPDGAAGGHGDPSPGTIPPGSTGRTLPLRDPDDGGRLGAVRQPRRRIEAIHAGVECGILAGQAAGAGLPCPSGRTCRRSTRPGSGWYIASVERVWRFLLEVCGGPERDLTGGTRRAAASRWLVAEGTVVPGEGPCGTMGKKYARPSGRDRLEQESGAYETSGSHRISTAAPCTAGSCWTSRSGRARTGWCLLGDLLYHGPRERPAGRL